MYYHKDLLNGLVDSKKAKVVLELGVRSVCSGAKSTSAFIFWEALSSISNSKLLSCDLENPKKDSSLIKELKESKRWHFFKGDTREMLEPIKSFLEESNLKVDILFIDTGKEYELTKFELENYSSLLSATGIILMHDVGVDWKFNDIIRHKKRPSKQVRADWAGHDRAVMEFLEVSDFKLKAQLGSYNMAVLFRDEAHTSGVKISNDLPYDNNRHKIKYRLKDGSYYIEKRRQAWNKIWKKFEK